MKAWSNALGVLAKVFLDHPQSLEETYWQHQRRALRFGTSMAAAGAACIIHALVPALFVRTASMTVQSLYDEMHAKRRLGVTAHRVPPHLDQEMLGGRRSTLQPWYGSRAS